MPFLNDSPDYPAHMAPYQRHMVKPQALESISQFCPQCGIKLAVTYRFCPGCGISVEKSTRELQQNQCANCRTIMAPQDRHCFSCGTARANQT